MTNSDTSSVMIAIDALTDAARQTRIIGQGTSNEHVEKVDFAEIACHVLASVAANLGGVEELLVGRSGSWDADLVRRMVEGTAGIDGDELLRYRTTPVLIRNFDASALLADFGIEELYDDEIGKAGDQLDAAENALFDAFATEEEKAQIEELRSRFAVSLNLVTESAQEETIQLHGEIRALFDLVMTRGIAADSPEVARRNDALNLGDAIRQLWDNDVAAYAEAYVAEFRALIEERGLRVPVEIVTVEGAELLSEDALEFELRTSAEARTRLPMTGAAPDWSDGTPADAVRRLGLTYAARAQNDGA